jgi:hypothetical protein
MNRQFQHEVQAEVQALLGDMWNSYIGGSKRQQQHANNSLADISRMQSLHCSD